MPFSLYALIWLMLEHHIEICHTIPCHQNSLREWVFSKCPKQSLPNCIEKCAGVTICSRHSNSELESDFWLPVLIHVLYLHSGYCTPVYRPERGFVCMHRSNWIVRIWLPGSEYQTLQQSFLLGLKAKLVYL